MIQTNLKVRKMKQIFLYKLCFLFLLLAPNLASCVDIEPTAKLDKVCEADFDHNGVDDIALLYKSALGAELIIIMRNKENYDAYLLYKGNGVNLQLSCEYSKKVEIIVLDKGERVIKALSLNSFVIKLIQPESSQSLFYWENGGFVEVWLSD